MVCQFLHSAPMIGRTSNFKMNLTTKAHSILFRNLNVLIGLIWSKLQYNKPANLTSGVLSCLRWFNTTRQKTLTTKAQSTLSILFSNLNVLICLRWFKNLNLFLVCSMSLWLLTSSAFSQEKASSNVVWNTQSLNSSASMPVGGGDIGLNLWVENGNVYLYLSKSGTFDENNTLLKLVV